jgi:predicted DNA-binding protein YlxM (UPF0122 family)
MIREALKMVLEIGSFKLRLERLQELATEYRAKNIAKCGKDAIDDCVKTCQQTYNALENKLLKIQGSTTKFTTLNNLTANWLLF